MSSAELDMESTPAFRMQVIKMDSESEQTSAFIGSSVTTIYSKSEMKHRQLYTKLSRQ